MILTTQLQSTVEATSLATSKASGLFSSSRESNSSDKAACNRRTYANKKKRFKMCEMFLLNITVQIVFIEKLLIIEQLKWFHENTF